MQQDDLFAAALKKWVEVFMHNSFRNALHFSRERGLSMSQMGAMLHIYHQNITGVSDLGEELGVTSAAASQLLDRLVQQGLILRTEDPEDRRAKQIVLTERGKEVVHESLRARQRWLGRLAEALSESEKEQARAALEVLIEKSSQLDASPEPTV